MQITKTGRNLGTPHACPHGKGFNCRQCWPKNEIETLAAELEKPDMPYTAEFETTGKEFDIRRWYVARNRIEIENCGYGYEARVKAQARARELNGKAAS